MREVLLFIKTVVLAVLVASTHGCNGGETPSASVQAEDASSAPELDSDPAVLGFTPAMRAEMRSLFAAAGGSGSVEAYTQKLMQIVDALKIAPNESGDYPPFDGMEQRVAAMESEGAVSALLEEFDFELPAWAAPLFEERRAGSITPLRDELLRRVVYIEMSTTLSN